MSEVNVVGETESPFTLGQQIQQWPGQRWEIEANLPPMQLVQAEQWIGFLGSLFGKAGTFTMGDYNRPTPQGPMSGAPLASGSGNVNGVNVLTLRGCTPNLTKWGIAGDYISATVVRHIDLGPPQRLYKLLNDVATDSGGNAILNIFPNIRETIAAGTVMIVNNCVGTFRMQDNLVKWKVDRNRVYTISFKAKEAI